MISCNNKWGRLREIVLGSSYSADFYSNIKNPRIKSCLTRIADETEEDYCYFESQLKSHGIVVHRPYLDPNDRIENHVMEDGRITTSWQTINGTEINTCPSPDKFVSNTLIPKPPMTPRDSWAVIDGELVMTATDHPSTETLLAEICKKKGAGYHTSYELFGADFSGGCLYQVGRDIFLGEETLDPESKIKIQQRYPNHRWHFVDITGHCDGVYHLVKPGAMISLKDMKCYESEFPDWDILYLPDQGWANMAAFAKLKRLNQGKWWLPGEEENDEFTEFVETWLNNWVGYVEETVFDVNCLMLDEHHIFVNNYHKEVFEFLAKHRIEPIIIPFRHRFFWDGGIHCITLELYRDGDATDYFR